MLAGHVKPATRPHCLGEDEDVEHIFWRCPFSAEARAIVQSKDDASLLDRLPACTRQCGVAVVPESEVDTSIAPLFESQSFPVHLDSDVASSDELWIEGFLVVASDGACSNQQDPMPLRRAGFGLFCGEADPRNVSRPKFAAC